METGRHNGFGYALLACICIVIAAVYWHSRDLGAGGLAHFDEFFTHDRTLGFSAFEDWFTVYSLGIPTLKKPPLQYWFSAGLIEAGLTDLIALRLPSLIFAAGSMLATAMLAYAMFPRQVWLMPASVLLLSTSNQFWQYSTSAMLDAGAVLFSTLGLVSVFMSLMNPRYWPTFPAAVFLAGMQKAPTPLAFLLISLIGISLTSRFHGERVREICGNTRFGFSVGIAFITGFAWQIFQHIRYWGQDRLDGSIEREMINRFIPENAEFLSTTLSNFDTLILHGEPMVRLAGFAGLLVMPFVVKRPAYFAMSSVTVFFVLIMVLGQDRVYSRYTLTILPLLCIGAAWLIFQLCRRPLISVLATVLLAILLGGPLRPYDALSQSTSRNFSLPVGTILGRLETTFWPGETAVFCRINNKYFPPGAIHVHAPKAGSGGYIYVKSVDTIERNMKKYKGGPVRGLCQKSEIDQIGPYFEDLTTELAVGEFFIWTASSYRRVPTE